jgi:hypothetical protein
LRELTRKILDEQALGRPHGYPGSYSHARLDVPDVTRARYVRLDHQDGHYTLSLLDEGRLLIGYGYKGPSAKRAEADLKYWTRDKKLEELRG